MRRLAATILGILAVTTGVLVANLVLIHSTGNVHAVDDDGQFYRSATLSAGYLERIVETKGIRTIVNLRGGEGRDWYEAERAVAAKHGVDFLSFHLSAKDIPGPRTLEDLLFVLKNAPRPILVHCKSGSDRTGLASALYLYAVAGTTVAKADAQLSLRYGHFPWLGSRTVAMDEAFSAYTAFYRQENDHAETIRLAAE
ncbi:protein tyrosine phosphatase [Jiella endophytica]|uniref:Protein tyrosine phosphatase n=1 Tax=Jiella endophytica TaxID=2558362 RepID=A0A4Y8RWD5_9HYPH|nr:tyrosine-protein phosphatase [Jiella endophytica]TFF27831.1 protein tyrosine phosphatase [Jiella endophytica]